MLTLNTIMFDIKASVYQASLGLAANLQQRVHYPVSIILVRDYWPVKQYRIRHNGCNLSIYSLPFCKWCAPFIKSSQCVEDYDIGQCLILGEAIQEWSGDGELGDN